MFFSSPFHFPVTRILDTSIFSHRSLGLHLYFFLICSLFCSYFIISVDLFLSSQTLLCPLKFAVSPYKALFLLDIVYFSSKIFILFFFLVFICLLNVFYFRCVFLYLVKHSYRIIALRILSDSSYSWVFQGCRLLSFPLRIGHVLLFF